MCVKFSQSCQMRERKTHKSRSAGVDLDRFLTDPMQHTDLVAQGQVLEVEFGPRTDPSNTRRRVVQRQK